MSSYTDLMPAVCREVLGRRTRLRRWIIAYSAMATVLLAAGSTLRLDVRSLRASRTRLSSEVQLEWARNREMQELLAEVSREESSIVQYQKLAWPIKVTDVLEKIASLLPSGASLDVVTMAPKIEKPTVVRTSRAASHAPPSAEPPPSRSVLVVDLEGVAPGDPEVAEFVAGLDESHLFADVGLEFSRSIEIGGTQARGFRVRCEVDLLRRYAFVTEAGE